MMPRFFAFLIVFSFVMPALAQVLEEAPAWVDGDHVRARLLAVPEGGNNKAVLEVELEEGWHSYGQDPGDAGLPPRFDWKGSINFQSAEVYGWPETFEKREMDLFSVNAYEGHAQYEMSITPEDPKSNVGLKLNLNLMVCKDICIPSKVDLALDLKAAPTTP